MPEAIKIRSSVMLPVGRLHPNDWNPNEQNEWVHEALGEEILEDGFCHPVDVVPCSCDKLEGEHFLIIGGEHRWKKMRAFEAPEIPAYVFDGWDETQQKLKTVRRNLLTGELNPKKFTALVKGLEEHIDRGLLPNLLGFESELEFAKHFISERDPREKDFLDGLMTESKRERFAVDSLHDIIGRIFSDCGKTLEHDYMVFTYRGSSICVVMCDTELQKRVTEMCAGLHARGENVAQFLTAAISERLKSAPVCTD